MVTDSQPASSRVVNDLQSTIESQQRQNAREIVSEEYTNIKWENGTGVWYLKFQDSRCIWTYCLLEGKLIYASRRCSCKKSTTETTKLMNGWTNNSPLKEIVFKAIHIIPSLLLQKPTKHLKQKTAWKHRRKELIDGSMEILTNFYLRSKQFNHIYTTSANQITLVNCLRTLLYWWKKEMSMVRWNYWQVIFPMVYLF